MSKSRGVVLGVLVSIILVFSYGIASADRGGWSDPPGGWDIVYEGIDLATSGALAGSASCDPGTDGDVTTWDDNWNPDDVQVLTITGEGETEDGQNPAADAVVLQLQDNSPGTNGTGRKLKFGFPFPGTYDTTAVGNQRADNIINKEGGVTIVMRFKVIAGTLQEGNDNFCYRADIVGGDASNGDDDRFGLGVGEQWARWCSGDDTLSTPIDVGDLTTNFRVFWIVFEPHPFGDLNNWMGTLYVDGSDTPIAVPMYGPDDLGPDGVYSGDDTIGENWFETPDEFLTEDYPEVTGKAMAFFGPGRTPGRLTVQYDYICWKAGAYHPVIAPPAAPSDLTATAIGPNRIALGWTDNSGNEDGFKIERKEGDTGSWQEIVQVGANSTTYLDTGLQPDTTYYYRVRAFNATGDSDYSNEASATTQAGSLDAKDWHLYN